MSDTSLPEKVRELLQSRRLPARRPDTVWGGPGSGRDRCLVCGDLMRTDQLVIDAELSGADGRNTLSFHAGCFWVLAPEWERGAAAPDSTDHPAGPGLAAGAAPPIDLKRSSG